MDRDYGVCSGVGTLAAQSWLGGGSVLVVAHRGASADAPENTLAAFRLAAAHGADGIEFDVRATADGHLVVIHDASLARTTDGAGEVGALTLEEIRRADAGAWRGERFRGERVPTLEEVLEAARGRLLVDIELKVGGIEGRVVELLARAGMRGQALITSFEEEALARVRAVDSGVAVGLLQYLPDPSRLAARGVDVYLPHVRALSAAMMETCRAHAVRVIPWTVRNGDEARAALHYGVDGLIADDPRLVRRLIAQRR